MRPLAGGKTNREEEKRVFLAESRKEGDAPTSGEFPPGSEALLPGTSYNTKSVSYPGRWSLVTVLLVLLIASQVLLWYTATHGWWSTCAEHRQYGSHGNSQLTNQYGDDEIGDLTKGAGDSKILQVITTGHRKTGRKQLNRHRRDVDDGTPPQYVQYDEFNEEVDYLNDRLDHMEESRAVSRLILGHDYMPKHHIMSLKHLMWMQESGNLLNVTPLGAIHIVKDGYYSLSINAVFSGRTNYNRNGPASCSLKVEVQKSGPNDTQSHNNTPHHTTNLLLAIVTQRGGGFPVDGHQPFDNVHASGVFEFYQHDVIIVKPGRWSLGCYLRTLAEKTHFDASFVKPFD